MILPLGGELHGLVGAGFGVFEDFAFVISDHDLFVVVIEDIPATSDSWKKVICALFRAKCSYLEPVSFPTRALAVLRRRAR